MTDLLHVLPDFPTRLYTHLIPSLEKNSVTTSDLLTLDPLDIAKRAQLPLLDVRRLANHVLTTLQLQLGLEISDDSRRQYGETLETVKGASLRKTGVEIANQWSTISTLDEALDGALGGGVPTGYITEFTGER